jgi:hypothetical protein
MKAEWIDRTERYLGDEMDPEERKAFEAELSTNEELRKAFELYSNINKTMSVTPNEEELKMTLQQMRQKYFTGGAVVKKSSFKTWLAVAASVLVIVIAGIYFLFPSNTSEKLYAQFAVHEPLHIQQRGNITDSLAAEAAAKFNNKDYYGALPVLQEYVAQQPDDIQAEFALGICNLELVMYPEAKKIFSEVSSGQTAYADAAKWYLALTALKEKNIAECRKYLENIPSSSSYHTKADQLLEKLPD